MRCEDAQRLMSLMLDDMLQCEDEKSLKQHLASCEHCKTVWDEWLEIRAVLRAYPFASISNDFERRLMLKLKTKSHQMPPVPSNWLTNPVFRLASSAMCGLFITALTLLILSFPSHPRNSQSSQSFSPSWWMLRYGQEVAHLLELGKGSEKGWQEKPSSSLLLLQSRRYRS